MRKLILCFTVLAALFVLAACGNGNGDDEAAGLRIAIVTSSSGVDDGSFNQNNYEGIWAFINNTSPESTVQHVHETSGVPAAAVQQVEDIVAEFDIIVLPGFQFGGISQIAQDNPGTYFILIDEWPAGDPTPVLPNVRAMRFAEQESGFLGGVVAALETNTGYVAFVGGVAFPPVVNYQFGFEAGVHYANTNLGTNATLVNLAPYSGTDVRGIDVGGNYVGDFGDPATGLVIGNALLAENVDVIFVAAGFSGTGVFTAVLQADDGSRVIGVDVDQFDQGVAAGGRNIVLTSALKVMDLNVRRGLEDFYSGNFQGGNYVMAADTDSTGIVTQAGRHQLSSDTVNHVNRLFTSLRDGSIVPPGNFSDFPPTDFPGLN